ncbi:MAG: tetratricopeptide repeat protein [Gemmatimonadetes bacterium]|nr:tetratricopeptide repeat protein [Gemmatimonadota bacterium]
MIEASRVLHPLDEAANAVDKLVLYESAAELGGAIQTTWHAVERSLRLLVRADERAPEPVRLAALSPVDLPFPRVLETLRQRNLLTLDLAGRIYELSRAAERAAQGDVRASDADLAHGVVADLRREVHATVERPMQAVAHHAVETGAVEEPVHPVPPAPSRRAWVVAVAGVLVLALVAAGIYALLARRGNAAMKEAIAAYQARRMGAAEQGFRKVAEADSDNVTARLYLARIYRTQGRYREAGEVLQQATAKAPDDPDVLREVGHLFMALGRPVPAAARYERAVQLQPDEKMNWLGLIRALRAAGDPRVDQLVPRYESRFGPMPPEARPTSPAGATS